MGGVESRSDRGHPPVDRPVVAKNEDLSPEVVHAVLRASGLLAGDVAATPAVFTRHDGTPGRVERRAQMLEDEPLREGVPVVAQVSRWDALKGSTRRHHRVRSPRPA